MKKNLFIVMMALMPLMFVPAKSYAGIVVPPLPLFSGTEVYALTGDTVTMDWNVYAEGASPFIGAGAGFIYAYTLNTANGSLPTYDINAFVGFSSTTGAGFENTVDTGILTNVGQNPAGANPGPVGTLSAQFVSLGSPGTATAWWSSTFAPTLAEVQINGISNTGAVLAPNTLGGVPEPETWALLLVLMAFTTWWMRRKQDEGEPIEASITA